MALFDDMLAAEQQKYNTLESSYAPVPTLSEQKKLSVESKYAEKKAIVDNNGYRDVSSGFLDQLNSESDGYSTIAGHDVQNRNKIYNTATGAEQQQMLSDVYDQRIYRESDGTPYTLDSNGRKIAVESSTDTGYLYMGHGKEDRDMTKIGFSKYGGKERYTPGTIVTDNNGLEKQYGWASGKTGIDEQDLYANWELPIGVAANAEKIFHGNEGNIGARKSFDDGSSESAAFRRGTGSGASEYYDGNSMPLFNAKTENIKKDNTGLSILEQKIMESMSEDERAKALGWKGTPPSKIRDESEEEQYLDFSEYHDKEGYEGKFAEVVDMAKGSAVKTLANFDDSTDTFMKWLYNKQEDTLGPLFGKSKEDMAKNKALTDKAYKDRAGSEFLDTGMTSKEFADSSTASDIYAGVNKLARDRKQKTEHEANEAWDNEDYLTYVKKTVENVPESIGDSAGEMLQLIIPGGIAITTGTRLDDRMDAFKKNNNRDMTNAEVAQAIGTIVPTIYIEKVLTLFGLNKIGKTFTGKGIKAKVASGVAAVAGSQIGETIQETSEAMEEQFNTMKRDTDGSISDIFSKENAKRALKTMNEKNLRQGITGGFAGGGMTVAGSAVSASVQAVPAAGKALNNARISAKENKAKNLNTREIQNLSDNDYKLARDAFTQELKGNEGNRESIVRTTEAIQNAENMEQLEATGNEELNAQIEIGKKALLSKESVEGSEVFMEAKNKAIKNASKRKKVSDLLIAELGLEDDATSADIGAAIDSSEDMEVIVSIIGKASMSKNLSTMVTNDVMSKNFDSIKNGALGWVSSINEENERNIEIVSSNISYFDKARTDGKKAGISGSRSNDSVDMSDNSMKDDATANPTLKEVPGELIKTLFGKGKESSREAYNKMTKYSNASLKKMIQELPKKSRLKKIANSVINDRASSARSKLTINPYATDSEVVSDASFSMDPKEKANNYKKITRLISQGNIASSEEVGSIREAIQALVDRNFITKNQAKVFNKRLDSFSKDSSSDIENALDGHSFFKSSVEIKSMISKIEEELKVDGSNTADLLKQRASLITELPIAEDFEKNNPVEDNIETSSVEDDTTESNDDVPTDTTEEATEDTKENAEPSFLGQEMSYNVNEIKESMQTQSLDDTLGEEMSLEDFMNKKCEG